MRTLKYKIPIMRGDDVRELQTSLTKLGYPCGTIDGKFGTKARSAVKSFQKANGLTADGVCGEKTWAKLNELLNKKPEETKKESKSIPDNPTTLEIQNRLIEWGFEPVCGKADGKLGKNTKTAIKHFQTAMSLSPDGVVGDKTKKALWGDIIVPRISAEEMKCQCTAAGKNYCNGYPMGKGYDIGVRILAERIMREVEKKYSGTTYEVPSYATPTPNKSYAGGDRCSKWNKERGGASGSQHKNCMAIDIYPTNPNVPFKTLRQYVEDVSLDLNKYGGVGYGAAYIVHIDIRGNKARWKY
jgi:hypothetical protein